MGDLLCFKNGMRISGGKSKHIDSFWFGKFIFCVKLVNECFQGATGKGLD